MRRLLDLDECTAVAPIFDPLSARIAEMAGWEVCKLSGSVGKFANIAVPDDVPISNMSDLVDVCRRITRVSDLPLIVDADDGGGSALNVVRTVRELEGAGVAAIELDDNAVSSRLVDSKLVDKRAPKGTFEVHAARGSGLVPLEEQVGKLKAAVAARRNPETIILARTSALAELTKQEALDRIRAYSDTGADALMFPGLPNGAADIESAGGTTHLPLCVLGIPPACEAAFLSRHRVRIRFVQQLPYAMAVQAIYDALRHLKGEGGAEIPADRIANTGLLRSVDRTDEFLKWQRQFMPGADA